MTILRAHRYRRAATVNLSFFFVLNKQKTECASTLLRMLCAIYLDVALVRHFLTVGTCLYYELPSGVYSTTGTLDT